MFRRDSAKIGPRFIGGKGVRQLPEPRPIGTLETVFVLPSDVFDKANKAAAILRKVRPVPVEIAADKKNDVMAVELNQFRNPL